MAWGPKARAVRTWNMAVMVVTLEVSKLSGWLKADADCRLEGEGMRCGGERCEPEGGRACVVWWRNGPTQGLWGPRARAERTTNM